jgi:hypothetical protein
MINVNNVFFFDPSSVQDFIRSCLQYRKEDRIEVIGLANHEYLKPPAQRKAAQGKQVGQPSSTSQHNQLAPSAGQGAQGGSLGPTTFSFANFPNMVG